LSPSNKPIDDFGYTPKQDNVTLAHFMYSYTNTTTTTTTTTNNNNNNNNNNK